MNSQIVTELGFGSSGFVTATASYNGGNHDPVIDFAHNIMIQIAISPNSLLDEGICVEEVEGLRLFKLTEALQRKLEGLLEKNALNDLSAEESEELNSLNELERFFTYLNARLLAQL